MFAGRMREVERLESQLLQVRAGRPGGFMLVGERGIGKTSLLSYLATIAEGAIPVDDVTLRFLVIRTDVDRSTTQIDLVQKIQLGLDQELRREEKTRAFLKDAWDFLTRVQAAGVSLKDQSREQSNELLIERAAYSLAATVNRITSAERLEAEMGFSAPYDGVLLLIDEADNAQEELELGAFLKLLSERVQRHDCNRLLIGLAGLPTLPEVLRASHESALRLFEEMVLGPLSPADVESVIQRAQEEYAQVNGRQLTIAPVAKSILVNLSEGLPHFIQQFGASAVDWDDDDNISDTDVITSATEKGGALDQIGDRYYRDAYFNRIKKDTYRKVLRIMSRHASEWMTKSEIRATYKGKESTLSNAIQALLRLRMIIPKEGEPGTYKLVHRGFALWIMFRTSAPQDLAQVADAATPAVEPSAGAGAGEPPQSSSPAKAQP